MSTISSISASASVAWPSTTTRKTAGETKTDNSAAASAALAAVTANTNSQPTITSLESQLSMYSQFASGSGPAVTDYKDLENAIETGNISDAQEALTRLQRDSMSASPATPPNTVVDRGGDNDGRLAGSINTTA